MQDHYLVAQAQDGGGFSTFMLEKGWDINVIMKYVYIFTMFVCFSGLRHKSQKNLSSMTGKYL